ncbi:hypothetical protein [Phytohabitans houttuyneae]|uniref:hypothetical protein n=1 Tax=Phytohabitans houttuyneae TaxID=1076126 RepID=UPI0031E6E2A8
MQWMEFPAGPGAAKWRTFATERTVLAAVHTMATAGHVLDAVELLEPDHRIQVVFTQAPDLFDGGVREYLRSAGAVEIGWEQATHTDFDLMIAADSGGVHRIRAPWLAIAHGVMNNKLVAPALGGQASHLVTGLGAPWLTWYGRLLPAVLAVSHDQVLPVLSSQCPEALSVATVVGDLCLDRLASSRPNREMYRQALAVPDGRRLVAISSTWGPQSLLGRAPAALFEQIAGLPRDDFEVVMAVHPAAWCHGRRQVLAWLARLRQAGLRVIDPASWRGLVAAADVVIGDHGSATIYAAAAGVPVLLGGPLPQDTAPRSPAELMAAAAPMVRADTPLAAQLCEALDARGAALSSAVASGVTSKPNRAAALLREQMYSLLRLPEPPDPCTAAPVGPAFPVGDEGGRW